jgi:hypothetical protein
MDRFDRRMGVRGGAQKWKCEARRTEDMKTRDHEHVWPRPPQKFLIHCSCQQYCYDRWTFQGAQT